MFARAKHPDALPRIILLTQFYDPEPAYKGQQFAEAVAAIGYTVEVVTGVPNYPGGTIYPGYRIRLLQRSVINGIAVTRLPLYPSHDAGKLGRVLNYISFFLCSFLYLTFWARKATLVYAYSPPVTVGLAAACARVFRRTPVVVDIHDLWPDTLPATGMIANPCLLRIIGGACNWMYRHVDHIILHTHGFRQTLEGRGVPTAKMTTVVGWTTEGGVTNKNHPAMANLKALPGLKLMFAGNMGKAQALDSVVAAAKLLSDQGKSDAVTFCFLGSGLALDALKTQATAQALANVVFLPRVPPHDVSHWLAAADCLLVHLRDDPLFKITLPSKTQAYMYAGRPILMAMQGEAAELVTKAGCGVVAWPQNPASIAESALRLAEMPETERVAMGQAGRGYYDRELSLSQGIARFGFIFDRVRRRDI